MHQTNDLRIQAFEPLVPPRMLKEELPAADASIRTVVESREAINRILEHRDERLLAVVGPCSIHDPKAAMEYAGRLNDLRRELDDRLHIVMRVYFEKPRTTLGWKGLILDPQLDGSNDILAGLRAARSLLLEITRLGLPAGSEMLDPIVPQYTSDLLSWASIGARTTESQTHREMASGLSMPVGFKNGTDGSIEPAINGLSSSRGVHSFIGIDQEGRTAVVTTRGNESSHIILRGGRSGPNYHEEIVEEACRLLARAELPLSLMIDCSHSNSRKEPTRQEKVLRSVIRQRNDGQQAIIGFMLESNLNEGRQPPGPLSELSYGVSITDACIGWEQTERALRWAHSQLSGPARS